MWGKIQIISDFCTPILRMPPEGQVARPHNVVNTLS